MSNNTATSTHTGTTVQIDQPVMIRADYVGIGISCFLIGIAVGAFLVFLGAKASRLFGSN